MGHMKAIRSGTRSTKSGNTVTELEDVDNDEEPELEAP
jgi:hypothetical protein